MDRLLRLNQFIPEILPISKAAWWAGVKAGTYPAPKKLGPRITTWRESDILRLVENGISEEGYEEDSNAELSAVFEAESPGIKTGACQGHGGCKNAKK